MSVPINAPGRLRVVTRRVLVLLAAAFAIRYFFWRVTDTVNPAAFWFFVLFLAAEVVGFGEVILFYLTTWPRRRRKVQPAPTGRSVDIFIPTYNEPVDLLRDTAVCAVNVEYPHQTWLLDDGNRSEVRALAEELGCRYLTRSDRSHAKAGNLNHALQYAEGEFVVVLDADHVPMPDLIHRMLGFFREDRVALVQANQDFYNLDSFQHTTDWADRAAWQQQELFFNVIQPGKDAFGAAMYCGSPAMIRRAALDEVGGFAVETVTEDMHTGIRMLRKGWQVRYYNASVARGLAPQTFEAYATQWHRWGFGAMQVFRVENPLTARGLTLGQRVAFFSSFYFYWMSVQKLFYLLVPVFCVATGIFPLVTEPLTFAGYFLPYLGLNLAATAAFQGGARAFILTERYNLVKLGPMLRTLTGLFQRQADFRVTPKARAGAAPWRAVGFLLVLIIALVAAVVIGAVRLMTDPGTFAFWAYGVNVLFALFFLYLLVPAVRRALKRSEERASYRFPQRLDLPVQYQVGGAGEWREAFARNLNRHGLSITLDEALPRETEVRLRIRLPDREVVATASVRWNEQVGDSRLRRVANGLRFEAIDVGDQDAIAQHLFWEVAPVHGQLMTLTRSAQREEVAA